MHFSKQTKLRKLCTPNGIIAALAIDQRSALKRMMGEDITFDQVSEFKCLVSETLTPYASAILLDPEFGWAAAEKRASHCGLIMAYEKTGYDKAVAGRFPDLVDDVSVLRLQSRGSDAVKLLLYYDVDQPAEINNRKQAFVERMGLECAAVGLPFFLEIVTYDGKNDDPVYNAKVKPHKVITAMQLFSQSRFAVDVLKVEVPVSMKYVEGFASGEVLYTQAQAAEFFQQQSQATHLPFIFLSAGVSTELFQQTLKFAKQAGSTFNGVLCGRATWAGAADIYRQQGATAAKQWLETQGKQNISELLSILEDCATPVEF